MFPGQIKQFTKGWTLNSEKMGKGKTDYFSPCGSGSLLPSCQEWIQTINKFIDEYNIKSINDIGCGDLNFIKETKIKEKKVDYLGYDFIIRNNKTNLKIFNQSFNIATDTPRECDLCICKEVLNHLDTETQIIPALEIIKKTSKFLMINNYIDLEKNKISRRTGGQWEKINFNIHPYNLKNYLISTVKVRHIDPESPPDLCLSIYQFK